MASYVSYLACNAIDLRDDKVYAQNSKNGSVHESERSSLCSLGSSAHYENKQSRGKKYPKITVHYLSRNQVPLVLVV